MTSYTSAEIYYLRSYYVNDLILYDRRHKIGTIPIETARFVRHGVLLIAHKNMHIHNIL